MCLPCFPWTWTQYEDPLDSLPSQSVWVHDGNNWALQQIVSAFCFSYFLICCSIPSHCPLHCFCCLAPLQAAHSAIRSSSRLRDSSCQPHDQLADQSAPTADFCGLGDYFFLFCRFCVFLFLHLLLLCISWSRISFASHRLGQPTWRHLQGCLAKYREVPNLQSQN